MKRHVLLVAAAGVVAAAGCGMRAPRSADVAPGTPHVTWVMMAGDRENPDRDYVCQSDPRDPCVMPASRSGEPTFSHVYFYYHPAPAPVTYTGTIRIGFFDGGAPSQEVKPMVTVMPGGRLGNSTAMGIVSSQPGSYGVTFDLAATSNARVVRQIQDRVDVEVK
jgi:hypothetical protein